MILNNLTFVNTRPKSQAESLNTLLHSLGAKTINFPTLEIKTINSAKTKHHCEQLGHQDILIFLSTNAVLNSQAYWPKLFPTSVVMAIGPGTKASLKQNGITNVILPNTYNSEGILALSELSEIKNKRISIFCGKNPRPLLQERLSQKGAVVTVCECYQRLCPTVNKDILQTLKQKELSGIISTSKDSLNNLSRLLRTEPNIKSTSLIVISDSMKSLAKTQGWKTIVITANATNAAIVDTLTKLKRT